LSPAIFRSSDFGGFFEKFVPPSASPGEFERLNGHFRAASFRTDLTRADNIRTDGQRNSCNQQKKKIPAADEVPPALASVF